MSAEMDMAAERPPPRSDGAASQAPADAALRNAAPKAPPPAAAKPARKIVIVAIVLLLLMFAYHVVADRLTPYSSQAAMDTPFAQIAPQVSGQVVGVPLADNARVRKGEVLFQVDREPFEIALRTAEANLEVAVQAATVSELDVRYASADLKKQRIDLDTSNQLGRIVLDLSAKKAVSETTAIRARGTMETSAADVTRAAVELQRARERLGEPGDKNAKVKQARAAVEQARLDLHNTQVLAPGNGAITNLRLTPGQFVSRGTPVLTFIGTGPYWVSVALRENQLGNIQPGDEAELTFDEQPGHIFKGHVDSVGWGVSQGDEAPTGQLPDLAAPNGWLREPQRFPVRVRLDPVTDKDEPQPPARSGAQANVVVFANEHSLLNPLARLWIRAVALLSYLR